MTYEEAIKLFKDRDLVGRKVFVDEAVDLAIEALEKVAQLEKENKELKEKQTPMKPTCLIETPLRGTIKTYFCPRCNFIVWLGDKHCPECGQRLDWSK